MPPPPAVVWYTRRLPKRGHSADEYEDAAAADPAAGRFAVADGASESSFAGLWARLLAECYARQGHEPDAQDGWLAALRRQWAAEVDGLPLPWYAEEKRSLGAYAALLGFTLGDAGGWRAVAVGDCCLFQVRGDELVTAFPLSHSAEFGNQPPLLGSRAGAGSSPPAVHEHGRWLGGDRFLLMSDALAHWFLCQAERGRRPWEAVARLPEGSGAEAAFADWVERLRGRDGMRNDDVTLVTISPAGSSRE